MVGLFFTLTVEIPIDSILKLTMSRSQGSLQVEEKSIKTLQMKTLEDNAT